MAPPARRAACGIALAVLGLRAQAQHALLPGAATAADASSTRTCRASTAARAARGRAAVCVTGVPRTVFAPPVRERFNTHVVGSLREDGWAPDVFLSVSIDDETLVGGGSQGGSAAGALVTEREAFARRARRELCDVRSIAYVGTEPLRLRCTGAIERIRARKVRADSYKVLQQWSGIGACYDDVERAEAAARARYDWIVRLRTDLVFIRPLRLSALEPSAVFVPLGGINPRPAYRCLNDHMVACPRALCRPYFRLLEIFTSDLCRDAGPPSGKPVVTRAQPAEASAAPRAAGPAARDRAEPRAWAPDGRTGPPNASFVLPPEPRAGRQAERSAQWWFASRYGAQAWCREPRVYARPGQPTPCCGLLREWPWMYGLARGVKHAGPWAHHHRGHAQNSSGAGGGAAPQPTTRPAGERRRWDACSTLECNRFYWAWDRERAALLFPTDTRTQVHSECSALEKEGCVVPTAAAV